MKTKSNIRSLLLIPGILISMNLFAQFSPHSMVNTRDVIKNDFLVNDDTHGDLMQREPSQVAMNSNGDFVVVWRDERNGDFDVFFQRYNAGGVKQGDNTRVNDDGAEAEQTEPAVGIDDSGNFVVAWGDKRNGYFDVYMQRFASDGTPQGTNMMINDDPGDYDYYNNLPCVAMGAGGTFVIVWNDTRDDGDYDVWAQLYAADGTLQGANFKVNDDGETEWGIVRPGAGMDQNGNFVVCWADDRLNGNANVFAQQYQANGTPVGSNFYVNDTIATSGTPQKRPQMAMNKNGEFVIGWQDYRSWTNPDIYAQRYDAMGNPDGTNFRVTDDVAGRNPKDINVAISSSGNLVFTWYDDVDDFFGDAYAQKFDNAGNAVGNNFLIDDNEGLGIQEYPAVGIRDNNEMVFTYCHDQGDFILKGIRYQWDGSSIGNSFDINDDYGANTQESPAIDMNSAGNFVITWMDNRDDFRSDIFVQQYDASGNAQGTNTLVNDDGEIFVRNWWPDVAMADNGNFMVTWFDARVNDSPDIYAQRFTADGTPAGTNFIVNDDNEGVYQSSPAIASDASGNFVIVWEDDRDDDDIYAQRYSSDGTALGENFKVNENSSQNQYMPNIAMNSSGTFVITWADEAVYPRRIFAQIYNPDGTPKGNNINCSELSEWRYQDQSAVAIDDQGNFVVAWEDERHSTTDFQDEDIYARMFDADGNPLGPEFRVNDNENLSVQFRPSVTVAPDGGRFLIGWTDYRKENGDPDFMAQKYIAGEPDGDNVMINAPDWFPYMHQKTHIHSLASSNNLVCYTWMDNRRHRSWDIYGKLTDWGLVGVNETDIPAEITVYPNPVRDILNFSFENHDFGNIELVIADLSGREILHTSFFKSWNYYRKSLDVANLAQGIYLLHIKSGESHLIEKFIKK